MRLASTTVLSSIGLIAIVCMAGAKGGPNPQSPPYQSVLQQGDIKVTLLHVARITSFGAPDANGRAIHVPGVEVEYAVEDIGAKPLGEFHAGGVKCLVAGVPVATAANFVTGGYEATKPWSATDAETGLDSPKVASAERTRLQRDYLRGIVLERDLVDLHIDTGFDGLQTFKFVNVPLAAGGR